MLDVLRRRDFGLLWLGGVVSIAGDWILNAALPYFVYQRTGSTVATAGMIVAELAPSVLLGSVAGVFVDRRDRKRLLVASSLVQAATVLLLLLVTGSGLLWVVYLVAAVQSSAAAFAVPAESALLPSLVGDAELVTANALNALNNRLGRLLGIPAGGLLLGYLGLEAVVLADCASFLLAALLIAPIASPGPTRGRLEDAAAAALSAWESLWAEWRAGLGLVRRERTIATLFVVFGVMTFSGTMLDPLTVAWVRDTLGAGPQVYSWLLTAHAAAGIAGTLALGPMGPRLTGRELMGWGSVAAGIMLAVKFNLPSVALALGLSALGGVTSVASAVGAETVAQQSVPDPYRGRVFGSLNATLGLLSLLGAASGGMLAEAIGVVPMLDVAAGLIVLSGLVVLRAIPRNATVLLAHEPLARRADERDRLGEEDAHGVA